MHMKKVAMIGGSFNPPHIGHSAICEWAKGDLGIDEVWVIPCYKHPFSKNIETFEVRMKMCELAMGRLSYVSILDIEKKLDGKSVTIRTVEYLKNKYPDFEFTLLVGQDVKDELKGWFDYERLESLIKLVVVPRGGDSFIPDVSATNVRELCALKKSISGLVEKSVEEYIIENNLYE